MVAEICPEVPVLFVDTGYHFPETLEYRDHLAEYLDLEVQTLHSESEERRRLEEETDVPCIDRPDVCCRILKVQPLRSELAGYELWISGIRRSQTESRSPAEVVMESDYGPLRLHPLVRWTRSQVDAYIASQELPEHPLTKKGYRSVGCAPVTEPVSDGGHEREGRWPDAEKEECGLHDDLNNGLP